MPDPERHARAGSIRARSAAEAATAATVAQSLRGDKPGRRGWPSALAVFFLAVAVYVNILPNAFVSDDRWIIADNPLIRSLSGIPRLFTLDYWHGYMHSNLYRPVTMATFALNYAIGGARPAGYHAVNAILHGFCAVLVFLLARRFWRSGAGALVAGALFAVHPIHTEAVAAGFGRSELLAAAGVLGALLLHVRARESSGRRRALFRSLAVVAFAGGALSKESAFVFPALAALEDAAEKLNPFRRLRDYAPYAGAALVLLVARAAVIAGPHDPIVFADNPLAPAPVAVRLLTATAILGRYIGLLLWPVRLSADYSYAAILPISNPGDPSFLLGLAAVAALAALGIVLWRRSPGAAFGSLAFFVTMLPTANILFPIGTIMAERLLYLPSISICFLGAAAFSAGWRKPARARAAVAALAVVVCAALGARTVTRNPDWRDNRTLFESALAVVPNSFRAHTVLAEIDMNEGNDAAAKPLLERAIQIWPKWSDAFWRLGSIIRRSGDIAGSQSYFREAVRLDGKSRDAIFSLAETEQQLGHVDEAVRGYDKLASIEPCYPGLHQNLGYAMRDLGRLADAEDEFRRGIDCTPDSAGVYRGLALVLERRGDSEGAEAAYRNALARDSTDAVSANNLAWLLAGSAARPSDEALSLAERALRLAPDATVYDTMAWIRYKRGDLSGARLAIREAVRLDSTDVEIRGRRDVIEAACRRAGGGGNSS